MTEATASPRITHCSWGRIEVEGLGSGKDFKLYPGGGRRWDWRETGTQHDPGIQSSDVQELLDHGARVIILSQGMLRALRVRPETLARLEREGVEVHVEETAAAVRLYNELRESAPVGGLFHSTC